MGTKRKLTAEEYKKLLIEVEQFLTRAAEITEKIQGAIEQHAPEMEKLYAQRKQLFDSASGLLAAWIKHVHLNSGSPWEFYRNFLLIAEDEHLKKQYQLLNNPQAMGSDTQSIVDNPYLLQQTDEVDNKSEIDDKINHHALSRNELHEILANLSLRELTQLIELAQHLNSGNIWDSKYDL